MELFSFKNFDKTAVCTDGSAAGYYWKPAVATHSAVGSRPLSKNVWIVHLEGGGWCYDRASCDARCANEGSLCSSKNWTDSMDLMGIFWPKDDTLRSANKVFVRYCTSDGHMGDTTWGGRQFRGNRVIQAVFRHLVAKRGLGQGPAHDTVVFGGENVKS